MVSCCYRQGFGDVTNLTAIDVHALVSLVHMVK